MTYHIHDATLEDLQMVGSWLCVSDREELSATRDPDDWMQLAWDAYRSPVRKVVFDELVPVFAFGALIVGRDTANVWGFKTESGCKAVRAVTRYITRTMIPDLRTIGIRHAACLVHPDNAASQKWLAHLGFQPMATIPGFGSRNGEMILFQRDDPDDSPL